MVVRIEEIKEEGLRLTEPVTEEFLAEALLGEGHDTGFKAVGAAPAVLVLTKVGRGVLLKGEVEVKVKAPCKRCLADVEQALPVRFMLNLVPAPEQFADDEEDEEEAEDRDRGEKAGSFALEEADEELFDGKTIDLDPIVREQVLLALPMDLVCREDCKGLCPSCGQNLNLEKCACEPKGIDPRLAALKNIKLN